MPELWMSLDTELDQATLERIVAAQVQLVAEAAGVTPSRVRIAIGVDAAEAPVRPKWRWGRRG